MIRSRLAALALAPLVSCGALETAEDPHPVLSEPEESAPGWLMFQDAEDVRFSFDAALSAECIRDEGLWSGRMTMVTIDPETLWFTERPERTTFSMPTSEYVALFPDLFTEETGGSPNAIVAWDDVADAQSRHAVVALYEPVLTGDDLVYTVCALPLSDAATGERLPDDEQYIPPEAPVDAGVVSLFIDDVVAEIEDLSDGYIPPEPDPVYVAFSGGGGGIRTRPSPVGCPVCSTPRTTRQWRPFSRT